MVDGSSIESKKLVIPFLLQKNPTPVALQPYGYREDDAISR